MNKAQCKMDLAADLWHGTAAPWDRTWIPGQSENPVQPAAFVMEHNYLTFKALPTHDAPQRGIVILKQTENKLFALHKPNNLLFYNR